MRARSLVSCIALALAGCRDEPAKDRSPSVVKPPDSASVLIAEDSILDGLSPGRFAVTQSGDTLLHVGGGMLGEEYGASEYRKNGVTYLRIQRLLSNRPDGWPVWSTRARIALPPIDSGEHLLFAGLCGVADKSDPYLIAIAAGKSDTTYREVRRAWRFERQSEVLGEVPTDNVVCRNLGEG